MPQIVGEHSLGNCSRIFINCLTRVLSAGFVVDVVVVVVDVVVVVEFSWPKSMLLMIVTMAF